MIKIAFKISEIQRCLSHHREEDAHILGSSDQKRQNNKQEKERFNHLNPSGYKYQHSGLEKKMNIFSGNDYNQSL